MSNSEIKLVPFSNKYLGYLDEQHLEHSVRAWVAESEEKVYGLGGLILAPYSYTVFLKVLDESIPKMTIYRLIKKGFDNIIKMNLPVFYAIKDREICSADKLLKTMGFVKDYETELGEVYTWKRY